MKNQDEGLEKFYCGDENWNNLVSIFQDDWINSKLQILLLESLNNKYDLAVVIYGITKNHCLEYLKKPIPALNHLTPLQCIQNENLIIRLRECLMRTPW